MKHDASEPPGGNGGANTRVGTLGGDLTSSLVGGFFDRHLQGPALPLLKGMDSFGPEVQFNHPRLEIPHSPTESETAWRAAISPT